MDLLSFAGFGGESNGLRESAIDSTDSVSAGCNFKGNWGLLMALNVFGGSKWESFLLGGSGGPSTDLFLSTRGRRLSNTNDEAVESWKGVFKSAIGDLARRRRKR